MQNQSLISCYFATDFRVVKPAVKEMKNAPSALLSYIGTREFLRTRAREVLEKHEPKASASRTSRVFLKIRKCLYYSTMYDEHSFFKKTDALTKLF